MNMHELNQHIATLTTDSLKTLSYPSHDSGLVPLSGIVKAMGHNLNKYHARYPNTDLENKGQVGFSPVDISFERHLIDAVEQSVTAKERMAVVVDVNPFTSRSKDETSAENILMRHTTLSAAQRRPYYRTAFYDSNIKRRDVFKAWNNLHGSNQVNYVYGVRLMARAEYHVVESELPQTDANISRLVKELYRNFEHPFNVVTLDLPNVSGKYGYNSLSKHERETVQHAMYQKFYKALEVMHKNHIEVAVFSNMTGGGKSVLPSAVVREALQKALNDFVFLKGKKQYLKKIVFAGDKFIEKELTAKPLVFKTATETATTETA